MPSKVSRCDILTYYKHEVEELRNLGREWNIPENDIENLIENSFSFLEQELYINGHSSHSLTKRNTKRTCHNFLLKLLLSLTCLFSLTIFMNFVLTHHKPSYNFVVRNIQEYIYPSMRFLRWASLPIVRYYPSVTVWYDELCLVENPYFEAADINCWACKDVRSVLDLTGTDDPWKYQPHSEFPFITKGDVPAVTLEDIREIYEKNKVMMDRDCGRISTYNSFWSDLDDFMNYGLEYHPTENQDSHIVWRVNRLEPTRVLRKLFQRPKFLPSTINVERYVIIDELKTQPYNLPFPEGYKVFLMQTSGERLVVLDPVPGCKMNCSRVSVIMKPSYFLFYNGWFYRASSYPVESSSSNISISYLGSL